MRPAAPGSRILGHGFAQAIDPPAAGLGFELDPHKRTTHEMAVAAAMHCVNSIPAVCRAEPGTRTFLDLPLVSGRARTSPRPRG